MSTTLQRPTPNAQRPTPADALLREVALTRAEYEQIVRRLGRAPNLVELGMLGAMWSEHCGYKHSKPLLRRFPREGRYVLIRAGEENAGAVDIGDGLAVVMKIESHNHPSAVEPFQGAATGVGGIIRDIFTMGARPVALLDSLRFGPLSAARNRYLFSGVVGGVGWYGNCVGIPTVGGEVVFGEPYSANPLVNAMCVGVAPANRLARARAAGEGNTVLLVGADTGRDGLLGASFASLDDPEASHRGVVQVGNPFMEKLLIEACLEALATGFVVGMQDLGAAGLTSSTTESAAKGHSGIEIDVARVARRETSMTPYEVMLSESQERMLVVVQRGREREVQAVFGRWGLHSDVIGRVTADERVRILDGDKPVADLPVALLTEPPEYLREGAPLAEVAALQGFDVGALPVPPDLGEVLLRLLAAPNVASKRYVYRQYDHTVQAGTVVGPGGDAALVRVRPGDFWPERWPDDGPVKGLALATDGNSRYCYLDPYRGGMIAVAEAARNVSCVGATPVALTDCLNFGNPEKPDVYWQLRQVIEGMSAACEALRTPVISGNVSLYNETAGRAIYPTPIIGMLGLLNDVERHAGMAFLGPDHLIVLLGETREELGASEYLQEIHGRVAGQPPELDLAAEAAVQQAGREAIARGLARTAHDCADGGLAVALAECAIAGGVGFEVDVPPAWQGLRPDAALFGESQSRVLLAVRPEDEPALRQLATAAGVPYHILGRTGGDRLRIAPYVDVPLAAAAAAYDEALAAALGTAAAGQ